MNYIPDNESISNNYIDVIKGKLHQLDDEMLAGDVDILCKYIIIRFLKTSTNISIESNDDIIVKLGRFIEEIWPFLLAFISVVNSSPLQPFTSKIFGVITDNSEA